MWLKPLESPFWSYSQEKIAYQLDTNPIEGLSSKEAKKRLSIYGKNSLNGHQIKGAWRIFFAQLNNPLLYLLLFAAGLSLLLYDRTDAVIILTIIALSSLLGFFQEYRASKAMEKLLKIVKIKAAVIREGKKIEVLIEEVVPGDLVELSAGDVIPGDAFIVQSKDLYVDEAVLTGEAFHAEKQAGMVPAETSLAGRSNVLFMGTHVVSGSARAIIVATGSKSVFGTITDRLRSTPPETEFERGVRGFGYMLMEMTFVLLLVIVAFNVYFERPLVESILFALALSVGLTPQLLPAIISINLSYGALRMAKKQVIVKRLASIENFGSMTVLCADKTGTLTHCDVKLSRTIGIDGTENRKTAAYAYCNACFQTGYKNPIDEALLRDVSESIEGVVKRDELPYDFTRKRLSVLVEKERTFLLLTKGAFHEVLSICSKAYEADDVVPIDTVKDKIEALFTKASEEGYRVLGVAYKEFQEPLTLTLKDEFGMVFLGFLLFEDTLKEDAADSLKELKELGVSLKILTGDNRLAARKIAAEAGIREEAPLTGAEIRIMGDRALEHAVQHKTVFAEIEPNQKERIILALRKAGQVVGFLGDGINDVTALHAADVSITVDTAVDAAKETADIVLMEHSLSVLKEGILSGRHTFANTLKYIFMASSANFGNMFSMAGASLFLPFLPLLPKQVLLTNLLTDIPEMTIASDKVDNSMLMKPMRWDIKRIRKFMLRFGLISSLFDYATFGVLLLMGATIEEFRTGWFVESVVSATAIIFVIRTFRPFYTSFPSWPLFIAVVLMIALTLYLPYLPIASYLSLSPLPGKFYLALAAIVVLYIATAETAKQLFNSRFSSNQFHED